MDPMHQIHNNENGHVWQRKGKSGTKQVQANTGRRRLNIIGALNPLTLQPTTFLTEANCDIETMKIFFSEMRKEYADKHLVVFLDNARYQRAYETQEYAKQLNITLNFLPPYSPNLNLIERLWKFLKKKLFKNRYYEAFHEFEAVIVSFFRNIDQYKDELKKLLTLNFEIIKAS